MHDVAVGRVARLDIIDVVHITTKKTCKRSASASPISMISMHHCSVVELDDLWSVQEISMQQF